MISLETDFNLLNTVCIVKWRLNPFEVDLKCFCKFMKLTKMVQSHPSMELNYHGGLLLDPKVDMWGPWTILQDPFKQTSHNFFFKLTNIFAKSLIMEVNWKFSPKLWDTECSIFRYLLTRLLNSIFLPYLVKMLKFRTFVSVECLINRILQPAHSWSELCRCPGQD